MKDFVLDASVALGWLIDEPPSRYSKRVQQLMLGGARPLVPVHWHLEIANALLTAERRKILQRELSAVLADISALTAFIETDALADDIGTLVSIGQSQQLTAYDAAYTALALRLNVALATQDSAMIAAARRLQIPILR
jgi:predicted nucleic acid-binding protein